MACVYVKGHIYIIQFWRASDCKWMLMLVCGRVVYITKCNVGENGGWFFVWFSTLQFKISSKTYCDYMKYIPSIEGYCFCLLLLGNRNEACRGEQQLVVLFNAAKKIASDIVVQLQRCQVLICGNCNGLLTKHLHVQLLVMDPLHHVPGPWLERSG